MDDNCRFELCRDVRYRVVEDEAVVLRQGPGEVLILNEVAARVLCLVDDGESFGAIASRLVEEFEAPVARLRTDLEGFIEDAVAAGLIVPAAEA